VDCKLVKVSSTRHVSVVPQGPVAHCQAGCGLELSGRIGCLRVVPVGSDSQYSLLVCESCYEFHKWRATIRTSTARFFLIGHRLVELETVEHFDKIKVLKMTDEFVLPDIYQPVSHHVHSGGEKVGIPRG